MEYIAHRGLWFEQKEKNTLTALYRGLDEGYGLETDVRDLSGELVISHDVPTAETAVPFEQLLSYYANKGCTSTLAINIKSDGLQERLSQLLLKYNIGSYFVFDMSVPDTLGYLNKNMRTFIRRSEIEHHPELSLLSQGIWLDELIAPWVGSETITAQASSSNALCIVSPELHNREHLLQWEAIKQAIEKKCDSSKLLLCTDIPHKAERFFKCL
jgi:hypothetical protein